MREKAQLLLAALVPFALAVGAGAWCYAATGPTLGLFFGGVVFATLLTPPLVLAHDGLVRQSLAAAGILAGLGTAWVFAAAADEVIRVTDWLAAVLLLGGYVVALWGSAALLRRARVNAAVAAALVVVPALAWLGWPVWLSPWSTGETLDRAVPWLVAAHPLLALDGRFVGLGTPWAEQYYMYNRLSNLNQDVAYELPRGVLPAAALHAGLGAACLGLAYAERTHWRGGQARWLNVRRYTGS